MITEATEKENHLGMSRFLSFLMVTPMLVSTLFVFSFGNTVLASDPACKMIDKPRRELVELRKRSNMLGKELTDVVRQLPSDGQQKYLQRYRTVSKQISENYMKGTRAMTCAETLAWYRGLVAQERRLIELHESSLQEIENEQESTPPPGGVYSRWRGAVPGILSGSPPGVSPDDGYAKKNKASRFYDGLLDKNDRRDEKLYNLAELNQRLRKGQNEIFDRKEELKTEIKAKKTEIKKLKKSISVGALLKERLRITRDRTKTPNEKVRLSKELDYRKKETEKQLKSLEKRLKSLEKKYKREEKDLDKALDTYEIARQALDDIGSVEASDPGTWQDQMTKGRHDEIEKAQSRYLEDHPGNESIPVPEPVKEKPKSIADWAYDNVSRRSDQVHQSSKGVAKERYKTEHNVEKAPGEK